MKNLAIFGLAAATASFASGSLWNMKAPSYQVQTPEVVTCTGGDPQSMADYGKACFESTGGWWFAYVGDAGTMSFSPITTNTDGTYKLITTSEEDGSILPNGNLQDGVGLVVTMSAAGGTSSAPAIAGIGFNWTKAETEIDISSHAGYCITYAWTGSTALQMELGWKEATYKYDSWYTELAPTAGTTSALDLPWTKFKKDGWDKTNNNAIDVAETKAVSLKIRLKNSAAAEQKGTLTIVDLGWSGESCTAGGGSGGAAIKSVAAPSSVKLLVSDHSLSFSGLSSAANVEVINLQGQIVMSGVVKASSSLNLSKLDAGLYMVRVSGKTLNMTQKIILK